ncbi:dTDP-4-dehydrorhamnose 3,5-epimerase [Halovulum dunhuangense]|uniref:dTDP-4-dehydrorhamnose 3,5-epimerase n=1 Tax=Halovulum dunhuangense TaxID=1505036 RepID=A0A849L6H1_9RHOB|nr:dTDP-4-dehydrorhamnose 3,5-epimerase [Halovulum dunhuangense]NNU81996.1 dTDP-4-dehydrorhamnose 3,5-epimerase [Halovulum dunhuangense]
MLNARPVPHLPDLLVIEPRRFVDDRGYFEETWSAGDFAKAGIGVTFVQDNHSMSLAPGTLRGLHFQAPPRAQAKLVRCVRGAVFDVAVDIRRGSPTYGHWHGIELAPGNGRKFFIPEGFLHGFITLEPNSEVEYKCSDSYAPDLEGAVRWDSVGIDWPWKDAPRLSPKDAAAVPFSGFHSPFGKGQIA